MSRIAITLAVVAVFSGLAYYVFTHPDRDRVEKLREQYESLERENDELARSNRQLRQEIVALRKDPRVAERQARQEGGLARPDEIVVQFGERGERGGLKVTLDVERERMRLAGETVNLEQLRKSIDRLHGELPQAELTVEFASEVGALRREQVRQAVEASELAPATYPNDE